LYTPGKYFVIPDFQRPYSWDKANIVSFIEDLESVLAKDKKTLFWQYCLFERRKQ